MFNRLFGKEKQEKAASPSSRGGGGGTSVPASLEKLETSIELLEKREAVLQKKVDAELARAKELFAKKNKNGALQCMKRKKMYEEQLQNIASQKQNLETLKFTIQNQRMNQDVLQAQVSAKEELKKSNKRMNADKIEDNMDELMEEMDKANQVSEALRQPLDTNFVDEDELMEELELELEGATLEDELGEDTKIPAMPQVPSAKLPEKKTKEQEDEDELRALEAELAM